MNDKPNSTPLSVIIITYNAGMDIVDCLNSVSPWADEVFVVDSFSTDNTLELAQGFTKNIVSHSFNGFAAQRNWALENLPLKHEWVLFIDQDERVSLQLAEEVREVIVKSPEIAGFYIKRRFMFMGRWLKHGGFYPGAVLRLFRRRSGRVLDAGLREYVVVDGPVSKLRHDMIHVSVKSLAEWTAKHNSYADLEAKEKITRRGQKNLAVERQDRVLEGKTRLWLRRHVWERSPLLVRPFMLFSYRFIFRLGFLDGMPGLVYCFLHDLWYPFLIDAKCKEIQSNKAIAALLDRDYRIR